MSPVQIACPHVQAVWRLSSGPVYAEMRGIRQLVSLHYLPKLECSWKNPLKFYDDFYYSYNKHNKNQNIRYDKSNHSVTPYANSINVLHSIA